MWRTDGFRGAVASAVVIALCAAAGVFQSLEYRVYDAASSVATPPPLPEIVIVGMDDASLAALGSAPWSRDVYARLVDQLAAAGAKTIVLTPSFATPESDRGLTYVRKVRETLARAGDTSPLAAELGRATAEAEQALDTDGRLAASIQRAGNVFLASSYALAGGKATPLPPYAHRSVLPDSGSFATPATSARHPIAELGSVAAGIGHLSMEADDDGRVRRIPLLLRYDGVAVPSLALLATRHSLHLGPNEIRTQDEPRGVRVGGLHIATDEAAAMHPRFHAAQDGATPFPTVSFAQALSGKVPLHTFKDKVVLVGDTSEALAAPWVQPGARTMYPVEMLAHTVSAMRQGLGVQRPSWAPAAAWGAVLGAWLFAALVLPRLSRAAGWALSAVLLLLLAGIEWGLLRHAGQWISLAPGTLALLVGVVAFTALRMGGGSTQESSGEAAETDRMMGLALQGQGQLDMAFERLRKVPPSDALMDNLYHLAQDFERKRNFAKAKSVYKHILQHNRAYKDAYARYKRVRAQLQKDVDGPPSSTPASVPPASPRLPGDATAGIPMLGRYRIDKEIGKGAMGVVYLGRDPKIGRVVAIKTLALGEEFEGDALIDARARFFREAETAGRLQHPYIVTIFDAGEEHDLAYIAMEFLKGSDLTQACRAGQLLPVDTVLSIAARVAEALDYAHAHNVVHRDIKPANIMFDAATDAVKVTDFGIARITDSSKTRTGMVLGTPSFMSPEQLAGKKVDGRSDLYSLGVTLFQLLTGSLPLRGESMTELMHKIASVDAPDIRQLRPELSSAVARVVALALQKRPQARYQTGRQFASDLRQAGAASSAPEVLPGPEAVVYDADRDATGHEMADFQETVMEPPAGRGAASPPIPGAR
ncbi:MULTISPECIES: CHASE2 domain-containing serine/threonine-protein kinase [unclassified Acidovorax]|uniref:CHASE2 domain-containing serine/threonine-protein kinase n=1 Tax=unclassified Acidovorax TaxID=2684926 RepID=UPI001C459149|nr:MULTISPECIES: serine/threonine-protein kinase [unclassified Acidovorax]MBV7430683.1 CHASE2 domain-containing protein [Acidovorax sp. sif0732]MBV7449107.1 CHASE2 domain-containing protein [Acidovorax sp. sif0715]